MKKNRKLLNIGTFVFVALVIVFIGYVSYDKQKEEKSNSSRTFGDIAMTDAQPPSTLKDSIVDFGVGLLGTPYVAAGCSVDGFDCSGFVYFVYQHFDIKVPRSSAAFENFGKEVAIEDVQKGDLLLFLSPTRNAIGHIGIVSKSNGMESDFIHATSGREMKVVVTNLSNKGYTRRFVKAIRVL